MFYQKEMDKALRFGDVLMGYVTTTPNIEKPILTALKEDYNINVDINMPPFAVVISPCCSIGNKIISLTPLLQVLGSFFDNPYFLEDLTRINLEMKPQQTVSPEIWDKFPDEEKQRRLEEGDRYSFRELFIYEKNALFPKYTIHRRKGNIETNYYMIDFRNTYKLRCKKIISPENSPLESKISQLSIQTRSELRDKISLYYGKPPKEDLEE